ncbi:MAG TPA: ribosome recycling factor [Candidatus Saccharimonadales bacterium]|nr:ribosome recycling factor [Candidatus Saccharimonadales bacterium]
MDTQPYQQRMAQAVTHFEEELKKLRTGRAHASMLEGVQVAVYGSRMPLPHLANIVAVEAQLLQVTPFDPSNLQAIVGAIRDDQTLGFNPSDDGRVVRVPVPMLTTERRQQIVKQLGEKVEDARVTLRGVRHDALNEAKQLEKDKQISQDDAKRIEKAMDDELAKAQTRLDELAKAKETDILTV